MTRNTAAIAIACCICSLFWTLTAPAAEPMGDCLPDPVDRSGEQLGSAALMVANLGLGFFNAGRQAEKGAPESLALLGIILGAGSVAYAAAEDPEYSLVLGMSGAAGMAVGLFCLANKDDGPAEGWDGDSLSARVGPALIVPAGGKALLGLGLSAGF